MTLRIRDGATAGTTQDFFYDMFDGGYIDPEDYLVAPDAERVRKAMNLILEFREILEHSDLMEYY
jgi:hypothetical protein